jgi:hypothetical protein
MATLVGADKVTVSREQLLLFFPAKGGSRGASA